MDNLTFHLRLVYWRKLPGDLAEKAYYMSVYPAPLDAKFQALSTLYLKSSPQQQRFLIDFFAHYIVPTSPTDERHACFDNAIIYMRRVARSIRCAADEALLSNGLAVTAWTRGYVEEHDLIISLAFLHYAATRAGIDPAPHFETIATDAAPSTQKALRAFLHCEPITVRRMVQHYEGTC